MDSDSDVQATAFGLEISIEDVDPDVVRVALRGELDLVTSEQLALETAHVIEGLSRRQLVVDLRALLFVDSTGLRALWQLRQETLEAGGALILESPSDQVMRVLRTTKLDKIFQISEGAKPLR